jgi:hypothetical protein
LLLMLPIFMRDKRGLIVVQFSGKPRKVFVNHEFMSYPSWRTNSARTADSSFSTCPRVARRPKRGISARHRL